MLHKLRSWFRAVRKALFGETLAEQRISATEETEKRRYQMADCFLDEVLSYALVRKAAEVRFTVAHMWKEHPYLYRHQIKKTFEVAVIADGTTVFFRVPPRLNEYVLVSVMRKLARNQDPDGETFLLFLDGYYATETFSSPPPGPTTFPYTSTESPTVAAPPIDGAFQVETRVEGGAAVLALTPIRAVTTGDPPVAESA